MKTKLRVVAIEVAVPIILLAVWWWQSDHSKSPYFPPLRTMLIEFRQVYIWKGFTNDTLYSLKHFLVGFAMGVTVGFAVGLGLGLSDRARRDAAPLTEFFRAMPTVALIPIALVMVGPGFVLEAGLIAIGTTWTVIVATADGVRGVDPVTVETARSYGLSRPQQIRTVVIPAALPQVLAGIRVAVGIGITVMVISNMFASSQGLGAQIVLAQSDFNIKGNWAGIIMIAIVGIAITTLYAALQSRLLRWHRGWRQSVESG